MKKENKKPRIIVWDIETAPFKAYGFTFKEPTFTRDHMIQEDSLLCASWKLLGEKKTHTISLLGDMERFKKNPYDDSYVTAELRKVLCSADALIAHYGDKFDRKRVNDFLVRNRLDPLPKILTIDTWKIARDNFHFKSNRLDYIAWFLGLGRKSPMRFVDWRDCVEGNAEAMRKMGAYNRQDILLLEDVYNVLAPFSDVKLNMNLFTEDRVCPFCSSTNLVTARIRVTTTGRYKQYQCKSCGKYSQSTKKEPSEPKEFLK